MYLVRVPVLVLRGHVLCTCPRSCIKGTCTLCTCPRSCIKGTCTLCTCPRSCIFPYKRNGTRTEAVHVPEFPQSGLICVSGRKGQSPAGTGPARPLRP